MSAHPAARHARHLYKLTARATDMFGQIGNVLSNSRTSTEQVTLLLLETIGRLYKELGGWRKHLAVRAVREGLSQRAVADALQVSRRTIQVWLQENDEKRAKQRPQNTDLNP